MPKSRFSMKVARCFLAAVTAGLVAPGLAAESYPTRPVRLIVPFPPGGPSDVLARLLAQNLSEKWGEPVMVENRPGGLTVIGATEASRAPPDGHTLFIGIDATFSMVPAMFSKPPYDALKDFTHISLLATQSLVLLTNRSTPIKSVDELIAYARRHPEKLNFGSATTSTQLTGEMFNRMADVRLTYVPYKGNSEVTQAMLSGAVQVSFDGIAANVPYISDGRFTALATTGLSRSPALPEVPTLHELGLKGFEVRVWNGLSAPAGVPQHIVEKIQTDAAATMHEDKVKEKLLSYGLEAVGSSSEAYVDTIKRDAAKYVPLIKELGLRVE